MKHHHIKRSDPRWRADAWECVCGYKTNSIAAFAMHLNFKCTDNIPKAKDWFKRKMDKMKKDPEFWKEYVRLLESEISYLEGIIDKYCDDCIHERERVQGA